jgi:PAS domain S-box-containing protein
MNLVADIAKASPSGARWRRLTSGWFVPVLCVALVVMPGDRLVGADDGAPGSKKVLVLYTDRRDLPSTGRVDDAHRIALSEGLGNQLDYYSEYVDLIRFEDPKYQSALHDYLRTRYADVRLDAVIAASTAVLDFVTGNRDLFGEAPLVFAANEKVPRPPNSTGIRTKTEFGGTIALAAALQPELKHVFVVSGASKFDKLYEQLVRAQCSTYSTRLTCHYLSGLAMPDLQRELGRLPSDSIIFFSSFLYDGAGNSFTPMELFDHLPAVANAPTYSVAEQSIGHGVVGGRMRASAMVARKTASLALRVLAGEKADSIPVTDENVFVSQVDWRQLQRWRIPLDRVPADSVVLFRDPTLWSTHRSWVLGAMAIFVAQLVLIAALVAQRQSRREAEGALLRTEARNTAILRTVPDLMFVFSPEGVYLDYHAPNPDVLFVPPEQFIGRHMRDVLPPDLAQAFEPLLQQAFTSGEQLSFEYSLPIGGNERHYEARIARCDNDTVMCIVRDVTANYEAAEQLHQAQAELAQATRVRSLGELTTGIAHEVNQPLSAIITNARAGLRRLEGSTPPEDLRDVLQDIVSDGKRATDVIARVRGLVKQLPTRPASLDINEVIDDVVALSRRTLHQHQVAVEVNRGADLPPVTGDRVQLQQVLLNLVLNATDAMRSVQVDGRVLEISSARSNGVIRVSVHDSGPGLNEYSVRRIFTPFFTTKPDGMGVGLSISRSIVEAHGGRLSLSQNSDKGATFEFELPVS